LNRKSLAFKPLLRSLLEGISRKGSLSPNPSPKREGSKKPWKLGTDRLNLNTIQHM